MEPYHAGDRVTLYAGDCLDVLRELDDASVDAVVTDPPAGIGFMGRAWDHHKGGREQWSAWLADVMGEALRVCKPGAHAFVWALPRTAHWTACGLEDAGWQIRDRVVHLFGTGFPKSHNLPGGLGTALKPAAEDWWLARKPLTGTVAANVLAHGTGALNIDGCRIEGDARPEMVRTNTIVKASSTENPTTGATASGELTTRGRWPANVVLDESQAAALDAMSGETRDGVVVTERRFAGWEKSGDLERSGQTYGGEGGASRYFYVSHDVTCANCDGRGAAEREGVAHPCGSCNGRGVMRGKQTPTQNPFYYTAKAPGAERVKLNGTAHPTVKPLDLMRWLVRLVTPPGGVVLDPFAGSGTTVEACLLEGFRCVAIEREPDYLPLIMQRINRRIDPVAAVRAAAEDVGLFDLLGEEPA